MKQPTPIERELYENLALRLAKKAIEFYDENLHELRRADTLVYNYLQVFYVVIKATNEIHAAFVLVITYDNLPFDTPLFHASQLSKVSRSLHDELVPIALIIFQIDGNTFEVKGDRPYMLTQPQM